MFPPHCDAIVFFLKEKNLNNSGWDYPNQKPSLPFFISLIFLFHFYFNFRLNQLNKDQNHQKDFNNIRHADKKPTQNEVSRTNRVLLVWICWCIFPLFRIEETTKNKIDISVVVRGTYTSSLCKQFPTEWSLTFIHSESERERMCSFQWKKKLKHTLTDAHIYIDRMSIFCVFVIQHKINIAFTLNP